MTGGCTTASARRDPERGAGDGPQHHGLAQDAPPDRKPAGGAGGGASTIPVTTTDELIPSGETSSYRSNPLRLAEFTLSRREPAYVGRAKAVAEIEAERLPGRTPPEKLHAMSGQGGRRLRSW